MKNSLLEWNQDPLFMASWYEKKKKKLHCSVVFDIYVAIWVESVEIFSANYNWNSENTKWRFKKSLPNSTTNVKLNLYLNFAKMFNLWIWSTDTNISW